MSQYNRKRKHDNHDSEEDVIAAKHKMKEEEEDLNKILFGGDLNILTSLEEAEKESPSRKDIDSGVGETDSDDSDQKAYSPAWVDEEDDGIEIGTAFEVQGRKGKPLSSVRKDYLGVLQQKFTSIAGTPKWARLTKEEDDDSDSDELLQTCGFVKNVKTDKLSESTLEYKKVKDLNCETYIEGPYINAIEFHPTSSVGLVAGTSGVASLFAVNGRKNSKLHTVSFPKFPIFTAKFVSNGNEVIFGSRHPHIYSYDLLATKSLKIPLPHGITQCKQFIISPDPKYMAITGKFGEVHLLSTTTKEQIALLKQDSEVTSLCFNPTGSLLYGHSNSGEVTIWDINTRRVRHKWIDEGCLQGSKITISQSNQFLATGSLQGVVNVYNTEDVLSNKIPKPMKTAMNLTTGILDLNFNSSSEILSFSSMDIESSIRLLHLGSMSVFNNFPSFGTKLGHITVTNFSPGSGYFALGNKKSTVALYRLKHFKNY
nr:U3 small nucleolar RNA-associated protein 18 homolog [Onthophagus taurus]